MSNFFKKALPYFAGAAAGGAASQFSALRPFQAAISAGAGAAANSKNRIGGAFQGFAGGGVGSAVGGGINNMRTGGQFGQGAMEGLKTFGGTIPGMKGVGTSNPQGKLAQFFAGGASAGAGTGGFSGGSGGGGGRPPGGGAPVGRFGLPAPGTDPLKAVFPNTMGSGAMSRAAAPISAPANTITQEVAKRGFDPMEAFGKIAPGMALAGIGSAMVPTPDAPNYGPIKEDLTRRNEQMNLANQPAMMEYLNTLSAPSGASAEAGIANARLINDRQKAEQQRAIEAQFRANNGNIMGNSEYNTALTRMNSEYDQNYAAQAAQLQFQYDNQQKIQKMAAAQALRGLNGEQLQFYAGLADLDVQMIQDKFQLNMGRAQALKDIATQAGGMLAQNALGLNQVRGAA